MIEPPIFQKNNLLRFQPLINAFDDARRLTELRRDYLGPLQLVGISGVEGST